MDTDEHGLKGRTALTPFAGGLFFAPPSVKGGFHSCCWQKSIKENHLKPSFVKRGSLCSPPPSSPRRGARAKANLRAIASLAAIPGITVGYSDHTIGIDAAVLAVGLGARIIEKHFTLDKGFSDFRDHKISADPTELAELVRRIRLAESMLGEPAKVVLPCEAGSVKMMRRAIVAAGELPKGHKLGQDDLTWIRPAEGLAPGEEQRLLGRKLKRRVRFGEPICAEDILDA